MFYKMVLLFLRVLLPYRVFSAIRNRIDRSKRLLTSNKFLVVFWKILFFPIRFVFTFISIVIRLLLIWILPETVYGNIKYMIKLFYSDVVESKKSVKVALKRSILFIELVVKGRERKKTFGKENPDKTFFVIRPYYFMTRNELATSLSDLLFHYYRNLQQLSYAVQNGWIPVVDWENYGPFRHGEDFPINGTTNCWEYYWKQPSEYTLEEVYRSKNVILANRNSVNYGFIPSMSLTPPFSRYVNDLADTCPKYDKLFQLNDETAEYINNHQKNLFPENAKILGVSVRGNAYGSRSVVNHPIQPSIAELAANVRSYMEEWGMDYIFFTCESAEVVNEMKERFGDKLIFLPRMRYEKEPSEVASENPLYAPGRRYQTNLDYMTEMVLLSRCDSLVAGISGGVRAAIIWNAGKYENVHIFDKGLWK